MRKPAVFIGLFFLGATVGAGFRMGLGNSSARKSADVMGPVSNDASLSEQEGADVTPPVVAIVSPGNGETVWGTLAFNATATDDGGVERVAFFVDEVLLSSDTVLPYGATWNSRSSPNGNHTLSARAFDAAGNIASTSVVVAVNNPPLNFVVFLSDDQRFDTLWAMPKVQALLIDQGVEFSRAYATTPVCCPDRASLLSGGFYAYNTGVLTLNSPNGGATLFRDDNSLPLRLQESGYVTAMLGKYLNSYNSMVNLNAGTGYVPPGWTRFDATLIGGQTANWFDFIVVRGASGETSSVGAVSRTQTYITDYYRDQALQFLRDHPVEPFFLYLAPWAPHLVATPAPEDVDLFPEYVHRGRGYGETDLTDKPQWVQDEAAEYAVNISTWDEKHRAQLRSLQAVDRMVEAVVSEVAASGRLDNTVFIYTSDNGFSWGEHGLRDKNHPYEEAVRVPFIVRWPGVPPRTDPGHLIATNLDIGATVTRAADVGEDTDGLDLLPLLTNPDAVWRSTLFLEGYPVSLGSPLVFVGAVSENAKYIEYEDGFKEFYDFGPDPFEENNQISNPSYAGTITALKSVVDTHRGIAIITPALPHATLGVAYSTALSAWGGGGGYVWSLSSGSLPAGLSLASDGVISGTPTVRRTSTISLRVEGTSNARQAGRRQRFIKQFAITVN